MPDVELEAPELDDVDQEAPAYKRAVALIVVLITLFGSIVAYWQAVESNKEDVAARDAQRDAITGLGSQVDASAAFAADLRIGSELDVQLQRQALNAGRVATFGDDPDSDLHLAAAERFAAVRTAIAGLTPLDPGDPSSISDDAAAGNESADAARLRQLVEADRANDHGSNADSYVAVLTVLAVALFLLGLSLTVQGRSRNVLAAPGVAIALVCVGWTAIIASRGATDVSEQAVRAAAEGQRLQDAGNFEGAIEAYDAAIEDSPDFAVAFARRADALFAQGSAQIGQTGFISITSPEALEAALEDTETALELGAGDDVVTLADAAFLFFLDGDFDRSAQLSSDALDLNDQLAQVWFNLGVAEVAQGNEREAARAYREGRQILADAPDAGTRGQILAGARTDLSVLRDLLDGDDLDDVIDIIQSTEGELAAFEASFVELPCDAEPCPTADAVGNDAAMGELTVSSSGAFVFGNYPVEGVEPGTPVTTVWYVRTEDGAPFEQTALPLSVGRVGDDGTIGASTLPRLDPACPVPGEYMVRAYAGERFLGEGAATVEPGRTGAAFFAEVDPIEGFTACVPEGFEVSRADVTDIDSFTNFIGEDFSWSMNVTPGALPDGADGPTVSEELLADFLGVDQAALTPITFNGRSVDGGFIPISGFGGVDPVDGTVVAFAAGPDGSSRNILLSGEVDMELLQEIIGLIDFTGVSVP
jgi:tetratricopeptide (TPR) repeat protein